MADVLLFLALSTGRMLAAYMISLVLALVLGYYMAKEHIIERILMPILDILQAIPILIFFPPAIFFFIDKFPGGAGVEIAAIFLIVTSMVWNMIFSVYEGFYSLKGSMKDIGKLFRVSEFDKLFKIYFPYIAMGLISNSLVSWAIGWYFLIATEVISVGHSSFELKGIGNFIMTSAKNGDVGGILTGLLLVSGVIIFMDIIVWRPLMNMTSRYLKGKREAMVYDRTLDARPKSGINLSGAVKSVVGWALEHVLEPMAVAARSPVINSGIIVAKEGIKYGIVLFIAAILALFLYVCYLILPTVTLGDVSMTASAFVYSLARILVAFALSMLWVVPAVYLITKNKGIEERIIRYTEVVSSIPASAIFPAAILILVSVFGNFEIVAILFLMTGIQWYLFFNIYGGLKSVPNYVYDLKTLYDIKNTRFIRKAILPFIMPFMIIGSIAALGSGWNTTIIAEYVTLGNTKFQVWGIGSMVQNALADGNVKMMFLSAFAVCTIIPLIHITISRPMMRAAIRRRGPVV
jgi:NitT/TauT family transport system permease protein